MTCPVCGKPYPCAHIHRNATVLLDPEIPDAAGSGVVSSSQQDLARGLLAALEARSRAEGQPWRQEVISRVEQHRARRRRRFDPSASLALDFPAEANPVLPQREDELLQSAGSMEQQSPKPTRRLEPPKIIRFPQRAQREAAGTPRPLVVDLDSNSDLELAAPEAEQMELLPSFADIRLEEAEAPEENRLVQEMDLPPQPAPLRQRFFSGLLDAGIVLTAIILFAATFVKLAGNGPPLRLALLCAFAVAGALWLLFQYLFLVHGEGTPGMRAIGLELCAFAGRRPSRFARRGRALATILSGFSLGLGFVWSLVDEDTLGWHDRISQTYLRTASRPVEHPAFP
jgi:uncharacterized RDD family membrane protein YckC